MDSSVVSSAVPTGRPSNIPANVASEIPASVLSVLATGGTPSGSPPAGVSIPTEVTSSAPATSAAATESPATTPTADITAGMPSGMPVAIWTAMPASIRSQVAAGQSIQASTDIWAAPSGTPKNDSDRNPFGGNMAGGPPIPAGVTPNYIDPPTNSGQYMAAGPLLCALAIIFVLLRLGVKKFIVKKLTWDDLLIFISVHFAVAMTVIVIMLIKQYYMGRHVWDVPLQLIMAQDPNIAKNLTFITSMLYVLGIMTAKLSLLLLYLQIFGIKRPFRLFTYGMMAFVTVYCLTYFVMYATWCSPIPMTWHTIGWEGEGHCMDTAKIYTSNGVFNIATDIVLLLMPVPLIMKLQMSLKKKLGVLVVFATGIITIVAAVVREIIIVQTLVGSDQTWIYVPTVLWLSVELDVGIICTCLPTLRPLHSHGHLDKVLPRGWRSRASRSRRTEESSSLYYQGRSNDVEMGPARSKAYIERGDEPRGRGTMPEGRIVKTMDVHVVSEPKIEPREAF